MSWPSICAAVSRGFCAGPSRFDGEARVDLAEPVVGKLAQHDIGGIRFQFPPVAGVSRRTRATEDDLERTIGIEMQVIEVVVAMGRAEVAAVNRRQVVHEVEVRPEQVEELAGEGN